MGIQGLLPFLKKIHQPVNVSQFSGCTVAIDAYCWLHKGAFSCAEKLALGEKTDQYVYYCMKFINNLLSKNIKPVMVFDGCHLPSKKNVETSRREKRDLNRKKAAQFLREGKRTEARECLQRSIDISPEMALELMNVCRDKGVDCIVAPYEADSQLAYLNKIGVAQVIITEDSDLLLFGCEKVLFKMDHAGNGILIEQRHLNQVMEIQNNQYTFDKFRYMCILSGCDYLASLSGIGLVKANKVFKIARQTDIQQLLKKLSTYLKMNITVPQEYIDGFVAADNTFLYQLVYDPLQKKMVPLTPYSPDVNSDDMAYAGSYIPSKKAYQMALGNINIYSGEKFAGFDPSTFVPKYVKKKKQEMLHMLSMWDRNYRIKPKTEIQESKMTDRPTLRDKEVVVKANFKKRSPHKRLREAEDGKDVRSNTELSDLYGSPSPVKKKLKRDDIGDDLQRFMFASQKDNTQADSEDEEKPVQTGPTRSPRFFNSLGDAHPKFITDDGTSQEISQEKLQSPTKNVFVSKSPRKKSRFNLNAERPKEVKSRFFASSSIPGSNTSKVKDQSPKKTKSESDIRKSFFTVGGYKPVHTNIANIYNNSTSQQNTPENRDDIRNDDTNIVEEVKQDNKGKPFKFSKVKSVDREKSSPSPQSAFVWSKFKFERQGSSENISQNPQGSSTGANKPFKKVISNTRLANFLKQSEKEDNSISEKACVQTERMDNHVVLHKCASEPITSLESNSQHEEQESSLTVTSSCNSVESFPYSIDSACMTDTDLIEKDFDSQELFSDKNDQIPKTVLDESDKDSSLKKRGLSISFYPTSRQNSESGDDMDVTDIKTEMAGNAISDSHNKDPVVFLIDSDDDTDSQVKLEQKKDLKKNTSASYSTKAKAKSGCRVSGLSRRSKKSSVVGSSSNQPSLKDMLSKFAHNKSSQPKLSKQSSEVDIKENSCTPEGNTSLLNKKLSLQKNLLQY